MCRTLILSSLALCSSCGLFHSPPEVDLRLQIINSDGIDVFFDPNSDYDPGATWLYYYDIDNNYVQHVDNRLDYPRHFGVLEDSTIAILPVFGDIDGTYTEGGRSTTYIDFGNGDIDTLQVAGDYTKRKKIIRRVWYNGIEYSLDIITIIEKN